jgi:thioredoxin
MRHLFLLALLAALVACQSGNAQTETPADAQSESAAATPSVEKPEKPRVIGQGAVVDLFAERDPARTTVFDFTSEYCGPCRMFAPYLDKLHEMRPDITVVKVDINRPGVRGIDFGSPTAAPFRIPSIPHFKVMEADGTMIAEGEPARQLVVKWITELQPPAAEGR